MAGPIDAAVHEFLASKLSAENEDNPNDKKVRKSIYAINDSNQNETDIFLRAVKFHIQTPAVNIP